MESQRDAAGFNSHLTGSLAVTAPSGGLGSKSVTEARLGQVACCLSGKCSGTGAKEVMCQKGCGRGLHTMCAQVSHGHAKLANLTCLECRIAAVGLLQVPQERRRTMMVTMMMELTTGKASTAYGYGEYSRLETDFVSGYGAVAGRGGQGGSLLLRASRQGHEVRVLVHDRTVPPFRRSVPAVGVHQGSMRSCGITQCTMVRFI